MSAPFHSGVRPTVRVRILGPVDAVSAERAIDLGGRLEKMLLAVLAISANHAVSSDALAQVLWEDSPPASRDNTLQTYVSRLRAVLEPGRISSEDHSYELHACVQDLDALAFESLVHQAVAAQDDPEPCRALAKRALELWRGTPFGDFADRDPFRLEVIRLDELRLFVMELELESEIVLGHEELVTGTLEALAEEYPYRERIWQLLVAALALAGRRVEALRACNELRQVLGALGLEPSTDILRLEERILSEDVASKSRFELLRQAAHQMPKA